MNGRLKWIAVCLNCFCLAAGAFADSLPAAGQSISVPAGPNDLLQLLDGSFMHGEMKQMDPKSGLGWQNPSALDPINLHPQGLDFIQFSRAVPVAVTPSAQLRLSDGDELMGSVTSLNTSQLGFQTWFGSNLTAAREYVQSITFLSSNYAVLYEGPNDTEGWVISNHNPESWTFRDGIFTSGSAGTLGRDFKLSGSCSIEFELAWTEAFYLLVNVYGDDVDHLDYGNSYVLQFTREQVDLRHLASGRMAPLRDFGSAPLPLPLGSTSAVFRIQCNRSDNTVTVYVNNILTKRWKDETGFSANGGGLLFQQEGLTAAVLKLSNFKITQWEGRHEPETRAVLTNTDSVRFVNHDLAQGKITSIAAGKLTLEMASTTLQIPLTRVAQINFAAQPPLILADDPWKVRAHFPRGGTLSFRLDKWGKTEVTGTSAILGSLSFEPHQIRRMEFNLGEPKLSGPPTLDHTYEGLDE